MQLDFSLQHPVGKVTTSNLALSELKVTCGLRPAHLLEVWILCRARRTWQPCSDTHPSTDKKLLHPKVCNYCFSGRTPHLFSSEGVSKRWRKSFLCPQQEKKSKFRNVEKKKKNRNGQNQLQIYLPIITFLVIMGRAETVLFFSHWWKKTFKKFSKVSSLFCFLCPLCCSVNWIVAETLMDIAKSNLGIGKKEAKATIFAGCWERERK